MRNDLAIFSELEKLYPGALIRIRYEDYIMNVNGTIHQMYGHFGETPPPVIYDSLMNLMFSKKKGGSAFSQVRANATASLYKWVKRNSAGKIEGMTRNCKDVLLALGYPLNVTNYS